MDNTVRSNTVRTDLSLLLECLKFQMKCPDLQKQALLTIQSICEKRDDNVDLLREMGGVTFVYNLSKSSIVGSDVKETALFMLGTLAEANEAGQRICVEAFPMIKVWLQQIDLPRTEIFQPICSFIAMAVANNSCVQETFSALGCLDSLTLALVRLASAADTSLLSCQISVTISKTLSACITENSSLASGLAQYDVVSHLILLLASPHLDPEDRLSILLTLGHCTEASEEHQSQLVQCGGLPLIITLVTEDTSEEVRKAATFILQTCKQATMSLGVPGLMVRQGQSENVEPFTNLEGFRSSARELLRRIDLLEKRQAKEAEGEQGDTESLSSNEGLGQPSLPPSLPLKGSIKAIPKAQRQNSTLKYDEARSDNNIKLQTVRRMMENKNDSELKHMSSRLSIWLRLKPAKGLCAVQCVRALDPECPPICSH